MMTFSSSQEPSGRRNSLRILMFSALGVLGLKSVGAAISPRTPTSLKSGAPLVLIFVLEERILPGRQNDYLEGTKRWIDLIRKLDPAVRFTAFGDAETFVEFNQRIAGFEAIGAALESWREFSEASAWTEWGRKRAAAVEGSRASVWQRSAELSYDPAHPNPSPQDLNAFVWRNARVRTEGEDDFVKAGLAVKALFEKASVERGYSVFRNVIGVEGPAYSIILAGRDQGEIESWLAQTTARLAPDLDPLVRRLTSRVQESIDFRARTLLEMSLTR